VIETPSNKRMQLTKLRAAPVLQAEVPPCAPAGQTDGGTASQLIRSVRQTGGSVVRGKTIVLTRPILAGLVLVACCTACMSALQPRTTLEGRPFDTAKAEAVHAGQTEAEVRELLGEPFYMSTHATETEWRYYERFTPRGCDPPTVSQEFRVRFVDGIVVSPEHGGP
jgi:outer membrane protein assembly factor BamE (lipoprotein component of BamABCDE complex)